MCLNGSDEAPSGNEILSKKNTSRAAYKGHLSKLEKDILMFLDEFVPENLLHISKLKSYENNVAEQNEQKKRSNNEILELVQVEEFDKEMNSTFLFNDKIHSLESRIETCLALLSTTNPTISNASDLDSVSSNLQSNNYIDPKLPNIERPKFNGKSIEWQSFWDQFFASVDSKTNIPDVVKFSYLKRVLSKDVQESRRGFLTTNENYSIALKILRERYTNKQVLISSYMESFEKLQPITSTNNVSGLRTINDLVEGNVRNLSSLDVPSDIYDKLLVHLLIENIPHSLVISREFNDKICYLESMLKYFKKELFGKKRCASLVNEKPYNPNKRNEDTMSAFFSGQQKLYCVYCQEEHFPTKRDKVTDVNAQKEILKNYSCCYSCFKIGHVSKKCTKNYICRTCSKKQHISICEERNKQLLDQSPNTVVNLNHERGSKNVLLQSAVLWIENIENSNYCTDGRVLFNTGSQRSFAIEKVK